MIIQTLESRQLLALGEDPAILEWVQEHGIDISYQIKEIYQKAPILNIAVEVIDITVNLAVMQLLGLKYYPATSGVGATVIDALPTAEELAKNLESALDGFAQKAVEFKNILEHSTCGTAVTHTFNSIKDYYNHTSLQSLQRDAANLLQSATKFIASQSLFEDSLKSTYSNFSIKNLMLALDSNLTSLTHNGTNIGYGDLESNNSELQKAISIPKFTVGSAFSFIKNKAQEVTLGAAVKYSIFNWKKI